MLTLLVKLFSTPLGICTEIMLFRFLCLFPSTFHQQKNRELSYHFIVLVSWTTDHPQLRASATYFLFSSLTPSFPLCLDLFQRCMACTCHLPCSAKPTLEITASANTRNTHHRPASHCECQVLTGGKDVSVSCTRICDVLLRFSWALRDVLQLYEKV